MVALPKSQFYGEAEVCAVQVGCVAAGIRRWLVEDLASYGGQGEERQVKGGGWGLGQAAGGRIAITPVLRGSWGVRGAGGVCGCWNPKRVT